jgi:hypothetical protein
MEEIGTFYETHPPKPYHSLVHSAVEQERFFRLKTLRFFYARVDSYNERGELPVQVAMREKKLEMALYLVSFLCN